MDEEVRYAHHPQSKLQIALDEIREFERCGPDLLTRFLNDLNVTKNKDQVWDLIVSLCADVGQTYTAYGFMRYSSHEDVDVVIRSNLPDHWKEWIAAIEDATYVMYGRMHIWAKLTSCFQGIEYKADFERYGLWSSAAEAIDTKISEIGWRTGIFIPVRSTTQEEFGAISFGGDMSRDEFDEFIEDFGWTIHVAAMHAHCRYIGFLRQEEADQYQLTDRQMSFLKLSASGMEIKEIAHEWGTSVQAVTKVRRAICERFGVASKMAVMAKAARLDILTERDFDATSGHATRWY